MKIRGLYPESFGKFKNVSIRPEDGLNLVYGKNEAGKSTMFAFLRGMLFGIEKPRGRTPKGDTYSRYKPWDSPGAYQGTMDVEFAGKTYRVMRNFLTADRNLQVVEAETGREVVLRGELMEHFAPEVSEAGFANTVICPQSGAQTEVCLQDLLRNYIANMSMAKNREVNVAGALAILKEKSRVIDNKKLAAKAIELETRLGADRTRQLELDHVAEQCNERKEELYRVEKQLKELEEENRTEEESEFAGYRVRYDNYKERMTQQEREEQQLLGLRERMERLSREKENPEELVVLAEQRRECEQTLDALQRSYEERRMRARLRAEETARLAAKGGRGLLLGGIATALAAIVLCFVLWPVGIGFAAVALALLVTFVVMKRRRRGEARQAEKEQVDAERIPEELAEAEAALAALPSEEALSERRRKGIEVETTLRNLREQMEVQEPEWKQQCAENAAQRESLLAYFRNFRPIAELSEGEVASIEGELLAKAVQRKGRLTELTERKESLQDAVSRMEQQLESFGELEQRILETEAQLYRNGEEQSADERDKLAIALAISTIEKLSQDIHDSFGKKLNARMSELIEKMTNGEYAKLAADEKLQMRVAYRSRMIDVEKLSTGTIEQMYLAMRIAVAEVMYEKEELPLIFDDSFAAFDDERLANTLALLAKEKRQILLFTCHEREERLLKERGIAFHKITL